MTMEQSNRGGPALLTELCGERLRYAGFRCGGDSKVEGENTQWGLYPEPYAREADCNGDHDQERPPGQAYRLACTMVPRVSFIW
jgi:hypothetical protein